MTKIDNGTIDYQAEILRKSIHLCSLSIPIVYYFTTKEFALTVLIPLTLISLFIDIGRFYFKPLEKIFYKYFGFMLRKHEKNHDEKNLSGASYVFISASLVILLFPKIFVITGFSVLIISDIFAALIGRRYGKIRFLKKSLEGTITFFVMGLLVILFTPKITGSAVEYLIAVFAVAVGAIVENISGGKADDNLTIPFAIGLTMWICYYIFLPDLALILPNVPN